MRACVCMLALVLAAAPVSGALAQSADASVQEASDAPRHQVVRPNWRKIPTGDEMERFYPEAAMRRRTGGRVVMQCKVAREGTLYACSIISETPPNAGFGAAALKLAPYFEMTPQMEDGRPIDGGVVRIPVVFNIDGAARTPVQRGGEDGFWASSPLFAWLRALILGFIGLLQNIL